ncbi:VOC family protein [Streptomyces aurantiacus]|uniref:Putative Bleomycin resistance protein n=1 Tax=Streptomyces aurantiacus JA 4570 TaxID=1286094 RepID=S3ZMU7_9ACTN|nr:VOC family protein [Streptomyces aurantiacus]EPH39710.1 putative Bleomycin resistance protein [Streptomyces aurantiacus JA 4570]
MAEKTVPMLPCVTVQPIVDFYTALGFEATFLQKSPYAYAVVERGAVELHFFGMKRYDPAESISGCYVFTDEVDTLHAAFRAGLKAAYGKIPSRGLPRIGPVKDMSYGVRQFLMTDPAGNCIRVGQQISEDQRHRPVPKETFARALHIADLFVDAKQDLPGAAKVIDHALGLEDERPAPAQHLRLLVLRGDIAQRLGDDALAGRLLGQAAAIALPAEERESARDALVRLEELRGSRAPRG